MQYRKRPVVIDAVRWNGLNPKEVEGFITVEHSKVMNSKGVTLAFVIPTLEGDHRAEVGDWIIKGVAGEFYPCKPEIFAQTYEEVE